MSISSMKRLNIKLCREALFWTTFGSLPPAVVLRRGTHNNLYQMVKKRTLEARTKLQQPKFPNNQPCLQTTKEAESSSKSNLSSSSTRVVSKNTKVLQTSDCGKSSEKLSNKTGDGLEYRPCGGCGGSSSGSSGGSTGGVGGAGGTSKPCADGSGKGIGGGQGKSGGDRKEQMDKKRKILLGLLAALGAGGLLLYLLYGRKNKKTPSECESEIPGKISKNQKKRIPATSEELPKHVPYLLIGGGTASFSAFRAIKSNDARAKVLMITDEFRKPYMRPPLSKELWYTAQVGEISADFRFKQWTGSERSLFFEPEEFFIDPTKLMGSVNGGIAVAQGYTVKKVDPDKHVVTLTDGTEIGYDECLIATGCSPKDLSVLSYVPPSVREKIINYRTPDDFELLKAYVDEKKSVTIVGNGFIGSELACSLASYGKDKGIKIHQIFPEVGNMSKVLPAYLSKWTTKKIEELGVCVLPQVSIKDIKRDECNLQLKLSNGSTISTDIVVVAIGCEPNTQMASLSGLEVDRSLGGFVVNAELEARRNLFVAGDASCFYDPLLGRRRVDHHDHSVVSGRLAGENMVGKKKAYTHQSMFWSDLGPEIGYEGIGLVDASLPTVGVFALPSEKDKRSDNLTTEVVESSKSLNQTKELPDTNCDVNGGENYGRGVIFYMKDEKIVGILLWNLFNRIGLARTIINQNKKYDDLNEVAKLFEIHS